MPPPRRHPIGKVYCIIVEAGRCRTRYKPFPESGGCSSVIRRDLLSSRYDASDQGRQPGNQSTELELLAAQLGELEDKAFRLDQGHVSYLISIALLNLQHVIRRSAVKPVAAQTLGKRVA